MEEAVSPSLLESLVQVSTVSVVFRWGWMCGSTRCHPSSEPKHSCPRDVLCSRPDLPRILKHTAERIRASSSSPKEASKSLSS